MKTVNSQNDNSSILGSPQDEPATPPRPATAIRVWQAIFTREGGVALSALVCVLAAAYAIWYGSAGRFPGLPAVFNDYADLGESFLHGQLALLEAPTPQLKALPNPYNYRQRLNVPYHWDASYYRRKYYLYWGPVPGLVSAALERMLGSRPSGSLLVLLPYVGLVAVLFALLMQISERFFDHSSSFSIGLFVFLGLVNLPMLFLLGQPRIYEASITYGQFFLLAGLAAWALYGRTGKPGWLALAGLTWGLAVACRYNLVIAVVIFTALACLSLVREAGWLRNWRKQVLLLAPMAACGIAIGIYNFLRFGNPLESGFTYQLTLQIPRHPYSISYVASNFYIYLLYPLTTADKFPFIKSALFNRLLVPAWLHMPKGRIFDHVMIGMLPSVPALWLMVLGIPAAVLRRKESAKPLSPALSALPWMIGLAAAAQIIYILLFFYGAERYIADFYLLLILLLAMLCWKTDEKLHDRPWLRVALWLAVAALTLWTAGIGFFGSFGIPPKVLHAANPVLFRQMASYWDDRYLWLQAVLNKAHALLSGSHPVP
ncbi:MAG: hypothetical protein ACXWNQ_07960 [Anaerolineales bacterium]